MIFKCWAIFPNKVLNYGKETVILLDSYWWSFWKAGPSAS